MKKRTVALFVATAAFTTVYMMYAKIYKHRKVYKYTKYLDTTYDELKGMWDDDVVWDASLTNLSVRCALFGGAVKMVLMKLEQDEGLAFNDWKADTNTTDYLTAVTCTCKRARVDINYDMSGNQIEYVLYVDVADA